MKGFTLEVNGIERREYLEACRENGRRLYVLLAVSMIAICGLIIVFTGNASPAAFLWPLGIYIAVVGIYAGLTRFTYRDQLAVIDPPAVYEFTGKGWKVTKGDAAAEVEWKATPRLRRTRSCLFIYNDETNSSLLPLRLMTDSQVKALETWFRNSRTQAKEYEKKQNREARKRFREEHPQLRLGRTGPAWGPWRRK